MISFILFYFIFTFFSYAYDSYSLVYSGSINYFPVLTSPQTFGQIRNFTTSISYSDNKQDAGFIKKFRFSGGNLFYPFLWQGKNFTSYFGYEKNDFGYGYRIEMKKIGFGSYHMLDMDEGYLDLGVNLKRVSSNFSEYKNIYDFGLLIRKNEYLAGFSFENIGAFGGYKVGIPQTTSFSLAKFISDYSLGTRISYNKFDDKSSFLISLSVSHLIRTYRYGYFRFGSSISNSSKVKTFSFGAFYNRDVWELSWALSFMLNRPNYFNNAISLTVFWGRQDVETEYEKIIKREIKYRKDLLAELQDATKREERLKRNISELSAQIDELKYKIAMIEKELQKEKTDKQDIIRQKEEAVKTLNMIFEKQKKEKEELENIEKKRQEEKKKLLKKEFDREMEVYRKLKIEGSSKTALINYLKKIISSYQDSGIDISEATVELLKISKE